MPAVKDLWEQADNFYDQYRSANALVDRQATGGILRGIAISLSHIMKPYFTDADEVVKEILARGEARDAGRPHTTPGIENVTLFPEEPTKWYPSSTGQGYTSDPAFAEHPPLGFPEDRVAAARAAARAPRASAGAAPSSGRARTSPATVKAKRTFSKEDIDGIRGAHAAGFEMNMLMTAYSATEEEIRSVLA